ncbi:MAG: 2-hydroxyacid dehydrogenase [Erysipelotrichaceae bacterium]|jgi:D-lactate dehydrogenase|nr:2-hydroxyacid dehydrogenase [Erysipelotrichaceae bacterium]
MKYKVLVYDTKDYDRENFELLKGTDFDIDYLDTKIDINTAKLAKGYHAVCVFVNDNVNKAVIDVLYRAGIRLLALRSAGYNNVDVTYIYQKIHVVRVPDYSPYAVAEHAIALLLSLNRKIHKAYNRTRDHNFSLSRLQGFDLHGKTIGVIGTGKIGRVFIDICLGFGMKVLAYDAFPYEDKRINFVDLETLYQQSNIISLHVPLLNDTKHMINAKSIAMMKDDVIIINTSRGGLINSSDLLDGLIKRKIGGAALDVYEEEASIFFEDFSYEIIQDEVITRLIALPNVLLTSHQAFLTKEALSNIVTTTLNNIKDFFQDKPLQNEICDACKKAATCEKKHRCF